jgi:prophage antirepressor-like protein
MAEYDSQILVVDTNNATKAENTTDNITCIDINVKKKKSNNGGIIDMKKCKQKKVYLKKVIDVDNSDDDVIDMNNDKTLAEKAIDFAGEIFNFADKNFSLMYVGKKMYMKGMDMAEFLGYADTNKAIRNNVEDMYKFTLEEILIEKNNLNFMANLGPVYQAGLDKKSSSNPACKAGLKGNEKNTIYITEPGIYNLIMGSEKMKAKEFRRLVYEEFLPSLRIKGTYTLPTQKKKRNIYDLSDIKIYIDVSIIHTYFNTNVVYLIVIQRSGEDADEYLVKFGETTDLYRRFSEHKVQYGDHIKLLHAIKTNNAVKVESEFGKVIKLFNYNVDVEIDETNKREFFATCPKFTIDDAVKLLITIEKDNPTDEIQEKDAKIKHLELNNEYEYKKSVEETKQLCIKYKMELLKYGKTDSCIKKQMQNIDKKLKQDEKFEEKIKDDIYEYFFDEFLYKSNDNKDKIHCVKIHSVFNKWEKEIIANKNNHNFKPWKSDITTSINSKEFCKHLRRFYDMKDVKLNGVTKLGIFGVKFKKFFYDI